MDSGAAAPDPNRAGSAVPGVADGSSSATPHMQGDSQTNPAAHPRSGADPNAAAPTSPQNERLSGEMPASISEGESKETPVQNKENKAPEQLDSANDARPMMRSRPHCSVETTPKGRSPPHCNGSRF